MTKQSSFSEDDKRYMARAIELAKKGRFTTTPNPNVGCVLVKNNKVIGEGFHRLAGQGHAEVTQVIWGQISGPDQDTFVESKGHAVVCGSNFFRNSL